MKAIVFGDKQLLLYKLPQTQVKLFNLKENKSPNFQFQEI